MHNFNIGSFFIDHSMDKEVDFFIWYYYSLGIALTQSSVKRYANNEKNIKSSFQINKGKAYIK